jgi:hypothetical protein
MNMRDYPLLHLDTNSSKGIVPSLLFYFSFFVLTKSSSLSCHPYICYSENPLNRTLNKTDIKYVPNISNPCKYNLSLSNSNTCILCTNMTVSMMCGLDSCYSIDCCNMSLNTIGIQTMPDLGQTRPCAS